MRLLFIYFRRRYFRGGGIYTNVNGFCRKGRECFAAQFVAWFRWSNLGLLLAINGAAWLQSINMGLIPLVILFIIFSAFTNFFMGSASAKWAIIGLVFIPIFMLLGYSPELSQAVYRIGDSITNIVSPMMSFFVLIIVYYQKYDPKAVSRITPPHIHFPIFVVSIEYVYANY